MSKEIGARVLSVRSSAKLNQRDFAERLGISSGGLSQIESGKSMPSGDFLLRIHQEFGIDVTWLLTGTTPAGVVPAVSDGDRTLLANFHAAPKQVQDGVQTTLGAFKPRKGTTKKDAA